MNSLNLWNYRCGIEGMYKLKRWTFNLYGQLVGNTGYLSEMMNRNRFALTFTYNFDAKAKKANKK